MQNKLYHNFNIMGSINMQNILIFIKFFFYIGIAYTTVKLYKQLSFLCIKKLPISRKYRKLIYYLMMLELLTTYIFSQYHRLSVISDDHSAAGYELAIIDNCCLTGCCSSYLFFKFNTNSIVIYILNMAWNACL